jgi:hypothetical protein
MDEYSEITLPDHFSIVDAIPENSIMIAGGSSGSSKSHINKYSSDLKELLDMLTSDDYNSTVTDAKYNNGDAFQLINMLASEDSKPINFKGGKTSSALTYRQIKNFFDDLRDNGVNVNISLDDNTMSEFFGGSEQYSITGGAIKKKESSKKKRKLNEYMKLSNYIRELLKSKIEPQLGGRKIPAIGGTKVITHIITNIKDSEEEKIVSADKYFSKAEKFVNSNINALLKMVKDTLT